MCLLGSELLKVFMLLGEILSVRRKCKQISVLFWGVLKEKTPPPQSDIEIVPHLVDIFGDIEASARAAKPSVC